MLISGLIALFTAFPLQANIFIENIHFFNVLFPDMSDFQMFLCLAPYFSISLITPLLAWLEIGPGVELITPATDAISSISDSNLVYWFLPEESN